MNHVLQAGIGNDPATPVYVAPTNGSLIAWLTFANLVVASTMLFLTVRGFKR